MDYIGIYKKNEKNLISFARYLPVIIKIIVFLILDNTGFEDISGEFGLFYAKIIFWSYVLTLDMTSIFHVKIINNNINWSNIYFIQLCQLVFYALIFLVISILFNDYYFICLFIILEIFCQEIYRHSMIKFDLKTYTSIFLIKFSSPLMLLLITKSIFISLFFGYLVTLITILYFWRKEKIYIKSINYSKFLNLLKETLLNLPNSLVLRSVEIFVRYLYGNENSIQSKLNYAFIYSNGVYSLYDNLIVNKIYSDWLKRKKTFSFSLYYYPLIILILSSKYILNNLDFYLTIFVLPFILISIHSTMMNNLSNSKSSIFLILLITLISIIFPNKDFNFLLILISFATLLYNIFNIKNYEISYRK